MRCLPVGQYLVVVAPGMQYPVAGHAHQIKAGPVRYQDVIFPAFAVIILLENMFA